MPQASHASIRRLGDGRLSIRLASIPELSEVGGAVMIGSVKGTQAGLARTGPSSYVAFSLICPHQKVLVQREGDGWVCKAHGSEFEADGDLLLGPATSRLKRIPSRLKGGRVIVG